MQSRLIRTALLTALAAPAAPMWAAVPRREGRDAVEKRYRQPMHAEWRRVR